MLGLCGKNDKGDFSFLFLKIQKLCGEGWLLLRDCENSKDCNQV